jgi:hypothetical protein
MPQAFALAFTVVYQLLCLILQSLAVDNSAMSMQELKATERHYNAIRTYCLQHNLPIVGKDGLVSISKVNEQMRSKNPEGYEGVKTLISKSIEYMKITIP